MEQIIISGVSGGTAGIITDLIFFPIETIKTRIQASNHKVDYSKTAQNIHKYKGLLSQMAVSFPYAFIFFFTYDQTKRLLGNNPSDHLISAAIGETMANIFKNPFEVTKNQMQVGLDKSIRSTVAKIYNLQGIRGFYAGFSTILMREIPFSSIQFPIYEKLKLYNGNENYVKSMMNGAIAGGIAAFLTTPCDVLKSKLMTQRGQYYNGLIDCIRQIHQNEGLKGFFRAAHVRTLMISFSGMVFFTSYERSKSVYQEIF